MGGLPQWDCSLLISRHSNDNSLTGEGPPRPTELTGQVERVHQGGGEDRVHLKIQSQQFYPMMNINKIFKQVSFDNIALLKTFLCTFWLKMLHLTVYLLQLSQGAKIWYYKRILKEEDSLEISFRYLYYFLKGSALKSPNFKKSYLKKLKRYLNEIFSESSFIDVLLAYKILNL